MGADALGGGSFSVWRYDSLLYRKCLVERVWIVSCVNCILVAEGDAYSFAFRNVGG